MFPPENLLLVNNTIEMIVDTVTKQPIVIPIFIINDPKEYKQPKKIIKENFKDKDIKIKLKYLNKSNEVEAKLSDKNLFLMMKAKKLIELAEEKEFDPKEFEI